MMGGVLVDGDLLEVSLLAPTFWNGHGLTVNILTEGNETCLATS